MPEQAPWINDLLNTLATLPESAYRWIATVLAILIIYSVKRAVDRRVEANTETLTPIQRQWIHSNRTVSRLTLLVILLFVWLPSLSNWAFSLSAVAVAIVIATKELILCFLGTWFRILNKPFQVGDWIEINEIRGEILDFGVLGTKMLEMDIPENPYGYTGNVLTLPNSMFLSQKVRNITRQKKFTFHTFILTLGFVHETYPRPKAVQKIISEVMAPHRMEVRQHLHHCRQHFRTDIRLPRPQVQIRTNEYSNLQYYITLCCPTSEAIRLEQEICEAIVRLHYPEAYESIPDSPQQGDE